MRERLIQLLQEAEGQAAYYDGDDAYGVAADYLLDNGVIVLPCKIGDTIYRVGDPIKKIYEWDVMCIEVYGDETVYVDDSDNRFTADDIGKTVFLTPEEAAIALKARENK